MTPSELLVTVIVAIAIVTGIVGTVVPILPGLGLIWVAMLVYGVLLGFGWAGWVAMTLATLLVAAGTYLGLRIPQRSASGTGLSIGAQLLALGLAVVGLVVFPPFGFAIGFVLAVYLVRWRATGDRSEAWSSTKTIIGALVRASAAQVACAVVMFIVWGGWAVALALSGPPAA